MSTIVLGGCRAEPLGSYLKALGVLRLVGDQLDAGATGAWLGEHLVLDSAADENEILDFFATRYRPTPLLSPWNGGSGFGEKDKASAATVAVLEASTDERLRPYREALRVVRRLVASPDWAVAANKRELKREQVARCRNELPDETVAWIDATVVLTSEAPRFAPLFGTGGNDGRLEFSANFMANVLTALGVAKLRRGVDRVRLLQSSLLGEDSGPLPDGSSGPYDPGAGGGVNSAPGGDAGAMVNPWDYVLMFEGGLLFASGAARRLGTEGNVAAVPFCVDVSRVGNAVLGDGEDIRGEVWAPIWRRPATAQEVARLIGEGRAEWRGRSARSGVDLVRAAASLGVDRGIDAFVRHGLVRRFGLNYLAVALDRVEVGRRPEVRVTSQVDAWVRPDWSRDAPATLRQALRRVESTIYRVATSAIRPAAELQNLLYEVARLERVIAEGGQPTERARRPVHGLRAPNWLPLLEDGTAEVRLATAIASARDSRGASLALLVRPVRMHQSGRGLAWREGPPAVGGLGHRPITAVTASALVRRVVEAEAGGDRGPGELQIGFEWGRLATLSDVAALVDGHVDEDRLDRLVQGFLLLEDWPTGSQARPEVEGLRRPLVSPAFAVVGPCLSGRTLERPGRDGTRIGVRLGIESEWPALLASDRTDDVARRALRRLRMAGLDPAPRQIRSPAGVGERLATAAFCRLRRADLHALLDQICPPDPRSQENP